MAAEYTRVMSSRSPKLGRVIRGILLGLAVTLIAVAAYLAGVGEQAERWALDFRFRNLPTLSPRDDIVHIDIDDKSLEQIDRWPWPRRRLAHLIETLNTCGAKAVLLDIILPDPQQPRYVKEGCTDLYSASAETILNADAPPKPVLDDVELAQTLAGSTNVFLAMHVDIAVPDKRMQADSIKRLADIVATRPSITSVQAGGEMGTDACVVEEDLAAAVQSAYNRRIEAMLRDRPDQSLNEVLEKLFGRVDPGSRRFDIAQRTYLQRRALHVLEGFALPESSFSSGAIPAGRAVPPLVTMAQSMPHTGFVTITPDKDGVVRQTPLLVKTGSGVFGQLALTLAAETLAEEHGGKYTVSTGNGKIIISCPDGLKREIPVDADGYMLINWTPDDPDRPTAGHIPAVAVADVWQKQESLRHNLDVIRWASIEIARLTDEESVLKLAREVDKAWLQLHQARLARQRSLLYNPASAPPVPKDILNREADLEKQLDRACREMIVYIDNLLAGADQAGGQPDETEKQVRSLRELIRQIEQENPNIRSRISDSIRQLRDEIGGKICLVGLTATAAGDFIPTPVHRRTPGVVMHANILNSILSDRFARSSGKWVSVMLILLAGVLVTLITSARGPIESAILLTTAILGYLFISASVWKGFSYGMATTSPIAAMLLVFTVVTVYRQLTEQRHRRQITSTFKQYLSPAMVDELVDDPTQASLGGQKRQLSCLFADLAGFTTLSEHLGAEGTVGLLNRYLDRVGEILQGRYGGTLSKYEGDGIFAFFGAPIPQDDHARRAILSAIDCQAFLPELNRELHSERLLPEGAELSARIGITAGEVFVGNMGSTQRVAYTAIGDSVNLASRLETANKFFGSAIMVNDEAWRSVEDELIGRPLGKIIVVGKTEPVAVWEPLTRKADADDKLRKFADEFAHGVELYAAGDFKTAREQFQTILAERDDPAAKRYLQLCDDGPNQSDFDGVIRLTEK